jgi:hypothetical protein
LTSEPQILGVPRAYDRYYAIQLLDAYFNTFAYVGTRSTGVNAGYYAIHRRTIPSELPSGVSPIAAPTNHVMLMSRVRVIDRNDFESALNLQREFSLSPLSAYPQVRHRTQPIQDALRSLYPIVDPSQLGSQYFDELGDAMREDPVPPEDLSLVRTFASVGIAENSHPNLDGDESLKGILREAVMKGHEAIHAHPINTSAARTVNGWSVTYSITGYTQDPLDRAALGRITPGAQINKELLYFSMLNLDGTADYVLRFERGNFPPVEAFWSLTLSGMDSFLIENPIDRYVISDRTPGLRYGSDGSLSICISERMPASGPSNWLPSAPRRLMLCLRTYQPRSELLDGRYAPPALTRA